MATIKNNSLLKGLCGTLGEYYFRMVRGKTQIVKSPRATGRVTPKQRENQNRFREAANYAKAQMNVYDMQKLYQSGVSSKKLSAYHVAFADALNAPVIHRIDTSRYLGAEGDPINVKVTDDFKVVRVRVIITDGHGNHVECGEAVRYKNKPDFWRYTVKVSNPCVPETTITVSAFDIPENETTLEKVLE